MASGFANGREGLLSATVDALAGTLGLRDDRTGEHSERVLSLACRVGRRVGLRPAQLRTLSQAAQVHDIGKVGVPDAVLRKPGPLDDSEWDIVRSHSSWGADLVERIPGLEPVARIVRHHHERFDGGGYPARLAGAGIPLESRVLAVADAYVAMTEDRPYRGARSVDEALAELRSSRGAQFDPDVVDALEAELSLVAA